MKYIEAPNTYEPLDDERSIYLAGGITGTPDWQQELVRSLNGIEIVIFNPRRKFFPIDDGRAAEEQIKWEYKYLRISGEIAFWFPCETLCPIALYELGACCMTKKPIYLGVHPEYRRLKDIEIQTKLVRSDIKIVYSLSDLKRSIIEK
jgi:hypothetical protein